MILAKQGSIITYNCRDDVWRYDVQNATIRTWRYGDSPRVGLPDPRVPFVEEHVDRIKVVAMDARVFSRS
jgi:hypothetical protein